MRPTLLADSVRLTEDAVEILDRRIFPFEITYVRCLTVDEVAKAIFDMVTQSGGPFLAASAGLVLAARELDRGDLPREEQHRELHAAADRLIATRPTNNQIRTVLGEMLQVIDTCGDDEALADVTERAMEAAWMRRERRARELGVVGAQVISPDDVVLTHCWGEQAVMEPLIAAKEAGTDFRVICTETRPYLQGSRLTAHSVAELGVDVEVITDGMAAALMARGAIDVVITAADRVTIDGYVVNKIGTFQIALAAHALGVPYYCMTTRPDVSARGPDAVPIEERDGDEVLYALGHRVASPLVRGRYPAFDVTPPDLVTGIGTSKGLFSPADLEGVDWSDPPRTGSD